jgi:hypothetical protein
VDEDDAGMIYRFGVSQEGEAGRLLVQKRDGTVIAVEAVPVGNPQFLFSRAARAIRKHWERGEYPERTCHAHRDGALP